MRVPPGHATQFTWQHEKVVGIREIHLPDAVAKCLLALLHATLLHATLLHATLPPCALLSRSLQLALRDARGLRSDSADALQAPATARGPLPTDQFECCRCRFQDAVPTRLLGGDRQCGLVSLRVGFIILDESHGNSLGADLVSPAEMFCVTPTVTRGAKSASSWPEVHRYCELFAVGT